MKGLPGRRGERGAKGDNGLPVCPKIVFIVYSMIHYAINQ